MAIELAEVEFVKVIIMEVSGFNEAWRPAFLNPVLGCPATTTNITSVDYL